MGLYVLCKLTSHQHGAGDIVLADDTLIRRHDVEGTLVSVFDTVAVYVVLLAVALVSAHAHRRPNAVRDFVIPDGVAGPSEAEPTRVGVLLLLADIVLDEVVGAALLHVDALVSVCAEGVVVDPVVAADVGVDVIGFSLPQLNLWRLGFVTKRGRGDATEERVGEVRVEDSRG